MIKDFRAIIPTDDALPDPPVPPELSMERCPWMKLDVTRFLSSRFAVECINDSAFRAGLKLMLESWHMTPAGSLPNDDRALARLAGISLARWRRLKGEALTGFMLARDGRLYCPFVCREALEAAEELSRASDRREKDRARKSGGTTAEDTAPSDGNPAPTGHDNTEHEIPPKAPRLRAGRRDGFRRRQSEPATSDTDLLWRNRLSSGPGKLWLSSWGPRPDEDGCEAPAALVRASPWEQEVQRMAA